MTNNIIYISRHESLSREGFESRNIAKRLLDNKENNVHIECVPDFNNINKPNHISKYINPIYNKKSDKYTLIQYVPLEYAEYNINYKNIIIYNPKHFITRNKSIVDKLNIFDEIWVFDKNSFIFLEMEKLQKKTINVGYPFIPEEILSHYQENKQQLINNDKIQFYSIIENHQIENLESLIFNFVCVFNKTNDVKLVVYIDKNNNTTDQMVKDMLDRIESSFTIISKDRIKNLITILIGNIWSDTETLTNLHSKGLCYINLDYLINPHIITAAHTNKYILSICNISDIINFNNNYLIKSYRGSFKHRSTTMDLVFFNEYNIYPKILDESIKDKLILIYNNIKTNIDPSVCIDSLNTNKYFYDTDIQYSQ